MTPLRLELEFGISPRTTHFCLFPAFYRPVRKIFEGFDRESLEKLFEK
jgi:hypothetical protein